MSTYRQIPLTVNVDTRRAVDAVSLNPLTTRDAIGVSAGDVVVFCVSFVDNAGLPYPLAAGDAFELFLDKDLVRVLGTGSTTSAVSGTVTEFTVNGFDVVPTSQTGSLALVNANGDSEVVEYTSWTLLSGAYTFTIPSTALQFSYAQGDEVENVDPVMAQAGNTSVDVAGDWASISRAGGKISIRVDCTSRTFFDKVSSTQLRTNGYVQVTRTPSGLTKSSTMLLDTIYLCSSLQRSGYPAVASASSYYTETEADALFAPAAGSTDIATLGTIATGVWNGTDIAVADGGTGASTAAAAAANLGVPTIVVGSAAPVVTPGKKGDVFVDDTTPGIYVAKAATTSSDFIELAQKSLTIGFTTSTGAPDSAPSRVGLCFIDTSGPGIYFSKATTTSTDWIKVN